MTPLRLASSSSSSASRPVGGAEPIAPANALGPRRINRGPGSNGDRRAQGRRRQPGHVTLWVIILAAVSAAIIGDTVGLRSAGAPRGQHRRPCPDHQLDHRVGVRRFEPPQLHAGEFGAADGGV